MPPPLSLESSNRIVHDAVLSQITSNVGEHEQLDITIADFNQVTWHIFTEGKEVKKGTKATKDGKEKETKEFQAESLLVSVSTRCWGALSKNGGSEYLKRIYGTMLCDPEPKYDVSVRVPLGAPVTDQKAAAGTATKVAMLGRNMMAGVFHMMFERAAKRSGGNELIQIDYRPGESMWFKCDQDRVIVIFSIFFDDPDDAVIGKVFLTEVGKLAPGAPAADVYHKDPPKELAGIRGLNAHGYVSFLLEARHMAPQQREKTINVLMQFRNYMHYHIKCSKAYLHIRMRNRVNLLLQVLNRAKQEVKSEPKKTFTRR